MEQPAKFSSDAFLIVIDKMQSQSCGFMAEYKFCFAAFCVGLFLFQSEISIGPVLTENTGKTPTVFNAKI